MPFSSPLHTLKELKTSAMYIIMDAGCRNHSRSSLFGLESSLPREENKENSTCRLFLAWLEHNSKGSGVLFLIGMLLCIMIWLQSNLLQCQHGRRWEVSGAGLPVSVHMLFCPAAVK